LQLNEPIKLFEQKLRNDEKTLQNRLENFEDNEKNRDDLTLSIHKKIKKLEAINKGLKI